MTYNFVTQKLGFSLVLARFGDTGREVLQVEKVSASCTHKLHARDELVAVNGRIVVAKTPEDFQKLLSLLQNAPRPLSLTFVPAQGRKVNCNDKKIIPRDQPKTTGTVSAIGCPREKQVVIAKPTSRNQPNNEGTVSATVGPRGKRTLILTDNKSGAVETISPLFYQRG